MAGIVLEDWHLLLRIPVSVLRAASFKGRTLTADNSLRIRTKATVGESAKCVTTAESVTTTTDNSTVGLIF